MATHYRTQQTRKRSAKLYRYYLSLATLIAVTYLPLSASAEIPLAEVVIDEEVAIIPNVTKMTLDSFKHSPDSKEDLADLLVLGDLSQIFDLRDMTLGSAVAHWSSYDRKVITLDQYTFLSEMTIAEVADMSGLHSEEVGKIPIVERALETFLNHPVLTSEKRITLSQFLRRYPEIGSIKLGFLELSKYHHTAIPSLLSTPITTIPDWQIQKVSSIVGLKELPMHQDITLDGEIVTLSTVRLEDRSAIQLSQGDETAIWSEEIEDGLQPFSTFLLQPEMAGEYIKVRAFFKSCPNTLADCKFIGPFDYRDYKRGDNFYVSGNDWVSIRAENESIEFKRESAIEIPVEDSDNAFDEKLIFRIALSLAVIIGIAALGLLWLLLKWKKVKT